MKIFVTLLATSTLWSTHNLATAFSTSYRANTPRRIATQSMSRVGVPLLRLSSTTSSASSSSTAAASTAKSSTSFVKPERVIPEELPVLYLYDHCPFCVRVRVALGLKNIKFELRFLANDDAKTPTALVGKKIAPIFQWKTDDVCMAESLDIIAYVDGDERFGPTGLIAPPSGRTDLKEWQSNVRDLLRNLQRPRYVATGLLPEFQQLDGRHAFVQNHPVPGYEKDQWKTSMDLSEKLELYAELMAKDPAGDIEELNRQLVQLDDLLVSDQHCSEGGICLDDVDLFSRLRSITIIRGVEWPTKLRRYMDRMSTLSDVPLYDEMAL